VLSPEARPVGVGDRIDPRADDRRGDVSRVEALLHERPLLLDLKDQPPRDAEQAPEEVEVDGPLVVGSRHEDGLVGDQREPERGREIQVRVEDEPVVVVGVGADPLDQLRREGALSPDPLRLVEERVGRRVEPVGVAAEGAHPARPVHGEAAHADAVDRRDARRVDVSPREVVARTRGEHLDVVVGGQGLRHPAALVLGPPVDLRTVALHHEGEPEPGGRGHRSNSAPARVSRCSRRIAPMASVSKARSRAR
jgi:hypothetical protein